MNKKHALILVQCCVIPFVVISAVTIFRIPLNSVLFFGLILLCPLSHFLMMKGMMHGQGHEHHEGHTQTIRSGKLLAYLRSGKHENDAMHLKIPTAAGN